MLRDLIERQYSCRVLQWDEPAGAGDGPIFSALKAGRLIIAESLALLISELQDEDHASLCLMAA